MWGGVEKHPAGSRKDAEKQTKWQDKDCKTYCVWWTVVGEVYHTTNFVTRVVCRSLPGDNRDYRYKRSTGHYDFTDTDT